MLVNALCIANFAVTLLIVWNAELMVWEIIRIYTMVNVIQNALNKHTLKTWPKHASLAKLNVKIVLVHQQIALNVNLKESIKHFYSITVAFTHVLMATLKILILTNVYVQLMDIL